jgi:hypothetical protein
MALRSAPVRGPEFAERVRYADAIVRKAEQNNWDFGATPEIFAAESQADVIAKEIAFIHDGHRQTLIGNLVIGGIGNRFNLMGPIQPDAEFKIKPTTLLADIGRQFGDGEVDDFLVSKKHPKPVEIDFFNYTNFYTLRDLVFWHLANGSGCFPSALEHMKRHFAIGKVVQNNVYQIPFYNRDPKAPVVMQARCMSVSFDTPVLEWMDKPLFGGFDENTFHVEYLLTPARSKLAHPYLPVVDEGTIEYGGHRWHIRKFRGTTPKEALRGPEVPPEGKPYQR